MAAYAFVKDQRLFHDIKDYLPQSGYALATQPGGICFADFEEDADLSTATAATPEIKGATTYQEGAFTPSGRGGNNHVARLIGTYALNIDEAAEGDFALDVAAKSGRADVKITLIDAAGEKVDYSPEKDSLHAAVETGLLKWQYAAKKWEYKRALETVRFTKEAMAKKNPAFRLNTLRRVEITAKGLTEIDNIRIETD